MKLRTKLLTAVAGVAACAALAASISAYRDLGDTLSYYVRSDIPIWDNKDSKFAWIIHNDRLSVFNFTIANDDETPTPSASFFIKQWTVFDDKIVGAWSFQKTDGSYEIYTPADDYYAVVEYHKGECVVGNVQLARY